MLLSARMSVICNNVRLKQMYDDFDLGHRARSLLNVILLNHSSPRPVASIGTEVTGYIRQIKLLKLFDKSVCDVHVFCAGNVFLRKLPTLSFMSPT